MTSLALRRIRTLLALPAIAALFAAAPYSVSYSDGLFRLSADTASASRGADDRPGHIRGGHGADDRPGHIRGGHGHDDRPGHH